MNGFGFLSDNSLDVGQAWAEADGAAAAVLPERRPSRPFGQVAGEVPHAARTSYGYTSGYVREDRVLLDEGGLVAENTFLPRETLPFSEAVGSGNEYLTEKLKAKGWSGSCRGSCAREGNGEGECYGADANRSGVAFAVSGVLRPRSSCGCLVDPWPPINGLATFSLRGPDANGRKERTLIEEIEQFIVSYERSWPWRDGEPNGIATQGPGCWPKPSGPITQSGGRMS
jgi:hypothetical protein